MEKRTLACLVSGLAGALLETLAALELFSTHRLFQPPQVIETVLLHVGACVLFSPLFLLWLPPDYSQEKGLSLLLVFGFSITLPVVGLLLVVAYIQLIVRLRPAHDLERRFYFGDTPYLTERDENAAFGDTTRSIVEILERP